MGRERETRESDWGKNSCYYKYSRIGYLGDIVFDDFSKWNTHQWFFFLNQILVYLNLTRYLLLVRNIQGIHSNVELVLFQI